MIHDRHSFFVQTFKCLPAIILCTYLIVYFFSIVIFSSFAQVLRQIDIYRSPLESLAAATACLFAFSFLFIVRKKDEGAIF